MEYCIQPNWDNSDWFLTSAEFGRTSLSKQPIAGLVLTNQLVKVLTTIMDIIFSDLLILSGIINNKHAIYKLPHELPKT